MQFKTDCLSVRGGKMMARRYAELELKKFGIAFWCLQLYTPKDVTLHFDGCNFASWWLLLCMASSAELFGSQVFNIFLPHIERVTFCRREFYIPYENEVHSLREYTSFFTWIHFILVRNEVYSGIEHKILSAGNKYFPGLKILYSRLENTAINGWNKIKAISTAIQAILNYLIIKVGVNHPKSRGKSS